MAIVKNNIITQGLSGMLGGTLVFKSVGNKTIVSTTPKQGGEPTDKQKAHRQRFQQAVLYAKAQLADETHKAEYEEAAKHQNELGINAYSVAVADFLNAPDIVEVDLTNYHGNVGDTIRMRVTDDFKVVGVKVIIQNGDGSLVEQGNATVQSNGLDWVFTATVANASLDGDKILIQASDQPGNVTETTQTM
jgi:hypothetical protein